MSMPDSRGSAPRILMSHHLATNLTRFRICRAHIPYRIYRHRYDGHAPQRLCGNAAGQASPSSRARAASTGTASCCGIDNEAVVDLHRWAPNGPTWDSPPSKWILFSDLHVAPRTLPVCMEVLRRVRDAARERRAGIAFLGDFWHLRGSLPVEPLNEIVRMFSSDWGVQTLMLVGNHDQVSLGGLVHAMTPIAASAPMHVHIFDGPALYAGALWLPYRRDHQELSSILRHATNSQNSDMRGADGCAISAVFAHADVQGAFLNNAFQARDGLPPSLFPTSLPTYMGHYHKPHTVPGTTIRYVGSPYQVSRTEAGQKKALLVVDREMGWAVTEEIEMDIGPRHFESTMLENCNGDGMVQMTSCSNGNEEGAIQNPCLHERGLSLPSDLRAGDRLRLTLPRDKLRDQRQAIRDLTARGVAVEVATLPSSKSDAPRIRNAEHMTPQELFAQYAALTGLRSGAVSRGVSLLSTLLGSPSLVNSRTSKGSVVLSFKVVEVEGYFSFCGTHRYNLGQRGLVVLTGHVEGASVEGDSRTGMDSNGAGKTALVMAPLWALTGDVDARSELGAGRGLTNADVVNEDSKIARVRVEGEVNGVPFVVERRVVRRGRGGGLHFELGGQDLTAQEIRLTQAAIDAELAAPLLGRVVFYGQSEITALLESGDRAFKQELGKVVELDVWTEAKEVSKKELSTAKIDLDECRRELNIQRGYADQFAAELEVATETAARWEAEWTANWDATEARAMQAASKLRQTSEDLQRAIDTVKAWIQRQEADIEEQVTVSDEHLRQGPAAPDESPSVLPCQQEVELARLRQYLAEMQLNQGAAQARAVGLRKHREEYVGLVGHGGSHGEEDAHVARVAVCDRCWQSIDKQQYDATAARITRESEEAEMEVERATRAANSVWKRVQEAEQDLRLAREQRTAELQKQFQGAQEAKQKAASIENAHFAIDMAEKTVSEAKECSEDLAGIYFCGGATPPQNGELRTGRDAATTPFLPFSIQMESTEEAFSQPTSFLQHAIALCQQGMLDARSQAQEADALTREQQQHRETRREVQRLQEWIATATDKVGSLSLQETSLEIEIEELKAVDDAFKPTGIVSFVVEDALGALQEATSRHLSLLAPGITLELSAAATRSTKPPPPSYLSPSSSQSSFRGGAGDSHTAPIVSSTGAEQVEKKVFVRVPGCEEPRQRAVKQLSGGERRRVSIALALGFTELAARRGRLRSDLLVLDEVMQHLDGEGCARLASLLRELDGFSTVVVVAQARSFMTRSFDAVDVVVRRASGEGGGSIVVTETPAVELQMN